MYHLAIRHTESILRRSRGSRYQVIIPWVAHQHIRKEQGCAFHHRIDLFQIFLILRILIMSKQMFAKPRGRSIGSSPRRMLSRSSKLPDISQDMGHPATGIIKDFRRTFAALHLLFDPFRHRQMQLGQVGHFSRPMIHLKIDIQMIITIPGRIDRVTPQSLKIGRQ